MIFEDTPVSDLRDALRFLQQLIGHANATKGFHAEGDRLREYAAHDSAESDFANLRNYYTARLSLLTTEVAEAIEELRNGRAVDETYYSAQEMYVDPSDVLGTDVVVVADSGAAPGKSLIQRAIKPEGVPSEVADVVIRAFDFADEAGFDLAAIIEEKLAYNATRAHKHGREF